MGKLFKGDIIQGRILIKEKRYLGTCKATHQSCKCRPSVDWFLALFQRYPFEVPTAASQNYLKIVQIWIDVKKQLTISHIGPFINHPKYFFAGLIKNGETSHPLKNYFQNYCHKNKQFDLNKLLTTHFHEKNRKMVSEYLRICK